MIENDIYPGGYILRPKRGLLLPRVYVAANTRAS